jgi:hypothetical protein
MERSTPKICDSRGVAVEVQKDVDGRQVHDEGSKVEGSPALLGSV